MGYRCVGACPTYEGWERNTYISGVAGGGTKKMRRKWGYFCTSARVARRERWRSARIIREGLSLASSLRAFTLSHFFGSPLSLSLTSSLLRHFDPPLSFTFSHSPFSSIYVYILSRVRVIKYTGIESNRSRMTIGIYVTFGFADVCLADILAE